MNRHLDRHTTSSTGWRHGANPAVVVVCPAMGGLFSVERVDITRQAVKTGPSGFATRRA